MGNNKNLKFELFKSFKEAAAVCGACCYVAEWQQRTEGCIRNIITLCLISWLLSHKELFMKFVGKLSLTMNVLFHYPFNDTLWKLVNENCEVASMVLIIIICMIDYYWMSNTFPHSFVTFYIFAIHVNCLLMIIRCIHFFLHRKT